MILIKKHYLLPTLLLLFRYNSFCQLSSNYTKTIVIEKEFGESDTTIYYQYYDDYGTEIVEENEAVRSIEMNREIIDSTANYLKAKLSLENAEFLFEESNTPERFQRVIFNQKDTMSFFRLEKNKKGEFIKGQLSNQYSKTLYSLKGIYAISDHEKILTNLKLFLPRKYMGQLYQLPSWLIRK